MLALIKTLSAIVIITIALNGCSLIGLGVGAAIDSHAQPTKMIHPWAVNTINPGDSVTAHLIDGRRLSGTYQGIRPSDENKYQEKYDNFVGQLKDSCRMPVFNENVSITLKSGANIEEKFLGFDILISALNPRDTTRIISHNPDLYCYAVGKNQEESPQKYFLYDIKNYNGEESASINRSCIWKMAVAGKLPLRSSIFVRDSIGIMNAGIDEISTLEICNKRNAKWWGLGLGLAVDATIIILMAATMGSISGGF
ncbi:MAG: hypothetical protein ABIE07_07195 [Candidatus Zixiibacteriota bacterium]